MGRLGAPLQLMQGLVGAPPFSTGFAAPGWPEHARDGFILSNVLSTHYGELATFAGTNDSKWRYVDLTARCSKY